MNRYEKRKKYIKSYVQDADGDWHYIGQWYVPKNLESGWKTYRRAFLGEIWLTALLTLAMGFLPAGPMLGTYGHKFNYVMLCYGLQIISALAALSCAVLVFREKLCLTEYDMRYTTWILGFAAACAACAAATAAAQLIYTVMPGSLGQIVWNLALALLAITVGIINFLFFRFLRKIPWQIRENH